MGNILETLFHWSSSPLGQLHLVFAYLALVSGPVVFFRAKGNGLHRILGYTYAMSMILLNVFALSRYSLTGSFNLFHYAALGSLATILPGIWMAVRFRRTRSIHDLNAHGTLMSWSYYGLLLAFVAETVTRQFPVLLHGEGGWLRFTIFITVIGLIGARFTSRLVRRHVPTSRSGPAPGSNPGVDPGR